MRKSLSSLFLTGSLIAAGCGPGAEHVEEAPPVDLAAAEAGVADVLDKFDQVWITEDLDLLGSIFAQDEDMVIFGTDEAELFIGYEPLQASMASQFEAYEDTSLETQDRVIKVHKSGEVAWFSQIWDVEVVAGGELVTVEGMRLTGVVEKRDGNWVIVTFHGSVPVAGQVVEY